MEGDTGSELSDALLYQAVLPYANAAHLKKMIGTIETVLVRHDQNYLLTGIQFCVYEMFQNTEQLNAAMVYESVMKDPDLADELRMIGSFEDYFFSSRDLARDHMVRCNAFISTTISFDGNDIIVRVMNNTRADPEFLRSTEEFVRSMHDRRDIRDALKEVESHNDMFLISLVHVMMTLKNMGCDRNAFRLYAGEDYFAVVQITMSLKQMSRGFIVKLSNDVVNRIETIPPFPRNVYLLQKEIRDRDWDTDRVVDLIRRDPGISASLMKTINSGLYMMRNSVTNLKQAVALLGKKGMTTLVMSFGARKVMEGRYGQLEKMWNRSYMCGAYTQILGYRAGHTDILDDLFLIGALEDIGKIVLFDADENATSRLEEYCARHQVDAREVEQLTLGAAHPIVGAHLAKKWEFPKAVIAGIAFHHAPGAVQAASFKEHAYTAYLANFLLEAEEQGRMDVPEIHPTVMEFFGLQTQEDVLDLHDEVRQVFSGGVLK